jgi:hypothetical protein
MISANPICGQQPLAVTFNCKTAGLSEPTYSWTYFDGVDLWYLSHESTFTHPFNGYWTFNVDLTVQGQGGAEATDTIVIYTAEPIGAFSGYSWAARKGYGGPGKNGSSYFSSTHEGGERDVWIDPQQRLHLMLAKRSVEQPGWHCTQVMTTEEDFSYGTYVFTVESGLDTLDRHAVLGMFLWDYSTFYTDGWSELDVELSRFGQPENDPLLYSVQPTLAGDGAAYPERRQVFPYGISGPSTHVIVWKPDRVSFATYDGTEMRVDKLLCSWAFTADNPPRCRYMERTEQQGPRASDPIIIPHPGDSTKVHMNFWWFNYDPAWDQRDANNELPLEQEVVISGFRYTPL